MQYDNYFENVVKFIRNAYPNTIVVLSGDHGPRDTPDFREVSLNRTKIDERCVDVNCGRESLYVASAVLVYYGDNDEVSKVFDKYKGQVYTGPADHQDLVYTLQKLMAQFMGQPLVSARNGRNLFDLLKGVERKHASLRATYLEYEFATESDLIRTHAFSSSNGVQFKNVEYPTCIGNKSQLSSISKEQFN